MGESKEYCLHGVAAVKRLALTVSACSWLYTTPPPPFPNPMCKPNGFEGLYYFGTYLDLVLFAGIPVRCCVQCWYLLIRNTCYTTAFAFQGLHF